MSAIWNAVSNDRLTQEKLKPWWESLFSFITIVMVVIALTVQLFWETGSFSCVPFNQTHLNAFGDAEAEFVRRSCSPRTEFFITFNMPWLIALIALSAFFAGNYWLDLPQVADAITSFVELYEVWKKHRKSLCSLLNLDQPRTPLPDDINDIKKVVLFIRQICWMSVRKEEMKNKHQRNSNAAGNSPPVDMELTGIEDLSPLIAFHTSTLYRIRNVITMLIAIVNLILQTLLLTEIFHPPSLACFVKETNNAYSCLLLSEEFMVLATLLNVVCGFFLLVLAVWSLTSFQNIPDIILFIKFAQSSSSYEDIYYLQNELKRNLPKDEMKKIFTNCFTAALIAEDYNFFIFFEKILNDGSYDLNLDPILYDKSYPLSNEKFIDIKASLATFLSKCKTGY